MYILNIIYCYVNNCLLLLKKKIIYYCKNNKYIIKNRN